MAGVDLAEVLGLDAAPPARGAHPDEVLLPLTIGPYRGRVCGPPPPDEDYQWLHVAALPPVESDGAGPVETLLRSVVGAQVTLQMRVYHQDGGLGLFLGATEDDLLTQARTLLSPGLATEPVRRPPRVSGPQAGVVARLQAERGPRTNPLPPFTLERLAAVAGRWVVDIVAGGVGAEAILVARRGAEGLADLASQHLTVTRQVTSHETATSALAPWQRVLEWLGVTQGYLTDAGAYGGWLTAIWASAESSAVLNRVLAALRGAFPPDNGRRFIAYDLQIRLDAPPPVTFLTSVDLAGLLAAPSRSTPGLVVRTAPPGHRRPRVTGDEIILGTYPDSTEGAVFAVDDLEGHAFVTGTTGSGKSTTVHRLLGECWNRHRIPFLVIDPVKDDYSAVAGAFDGGLTTVTGSELRMNLLQAWPDEDPVSHVTLVAQAFRGSFTMPSPTPYVVTQLFDALSLQPGGPSGADLYDVRDMLDAMVESLGYAPEARSNIQAALSTRLGVLLSPTRAHRFAWPDSAMVESLFGRPTVVTLADLVDDEERSFLVLLLALATWAHARARVSPAAVSHVLVLEEAHRVIPEVRQEDDPELGSARRVSASLLSAMLTEVRAFGEQVVVVDQSPARVSSDVLRNTNLKIAHRIVHPDDQEAVAGALGLPQSDADVLGHLERGQALVSSRTEPQPQTVQVIAMTSGESAPRRAPAAVPPWPCRCPDVAAHFRAWQSAAAAERPLALFVLAERLGSSDLRAAHDQALSLLDPVARERQAPIDCLAWAGLRRLLGHERRLGLLASGDAMAQTLVELYGWWADPARSTARRTAAESDELSIAALVDAWYPRGIRTALDALARPALGNELAAIRDWLLIERASLGHYLPDRGAVLVLRALVHREARRQGVGLDVVGAILRRAGMEGAG